MRLVKIDHVCFCYLATTSRLSALLRITHEKRALLKLSRSKVSRKLYLQVDKANKFKKISMNSILKKNSKFILNFSCVNSCMKAHLTGYFWTYRCVYLLDSACKRIFVIITQLGQYNSSNLL